MLFYPAELYNRYHNLYVRTEAGARLGPFAVTKYMNPITGDLGAGQAAKDRIIEALRSDYSRITGRGQSGDLIQFPSTPDAVRYQIFWDNPISKAGIAHCVNARGSPEEIERSLEAAVACGSLAPDSGAIQQFIDDYIGLDCAGFVGNFFAAIAFSWGADSEGGPVPGPSTPPRGYARHGELRRTAEEVSRCDVILWPYSAERIHQHIAIVGQVMRGPGILMVYESASSFGGLSARPYRLTGETKTMDADCEVPGAHAGTLLGVERATTGLKFLMFRRVLPWACN